MRKAYEKSVRFAIGYTRMLLGRGKALNSKERGPAGYIIKTKRLINLQRKLVPGITTKCKNL